VSALRAAGPRSYLIAAQTQIAAMQQTASYPAGWEQRFRPAMSAAPGVRVVFANRSAVIYTLHRVPGAPPPPARSPAGPPHRLPAWAGTGLIVLWLLLALLTAREFIRVWRPDARQIRLLTLTSAPLLLLLLAIIAERFAALS
jgi:hypothetical protein